MKKWILSMLCLAACGLWACGMPSYGSGSVVSSVGVVSGVLSVPAKESVDNCSLPGEYLSVEGDGEVLCLREDGTFLSYTVSNRSVENDKGVSVPYVLTEQIGGTYSCNEDGTVNLSLETLTLTVSGLEKEAGLAQELAHVFAGEDMSLHELYVQLFGGKEITGEELLGEEAFAELKATAICVNPDTENATFNYVKAQKD